MNNQETFDKIVTHLLKQNKQAKNSVGDCMYHTSDGLSCAVGCLIPEELYDKLIEDKIVDALVDIETPLGKFLQQFDVDLLCDLQKVHDYADIDYKADTIRESFVKGFHKVAVKYELRFTI